MDDYPGLGSYIELTVSLPYWLVGLEFSLNLNFTVDEHISFAACVVTSISHQCLSNKFLNVLAMGHPQLAVVDYLIFF